MTDTTDWRLGVFRGVSVWSIFKYRVAYYTRRDGILYIQSRKRARGKSRAVRSIERAAGTRRVVIRDSEPSVSSVENAMKEFHLRAFL